MTRMSGRWGFLVFFIGVVLLGTFCCLFFIGLPMYLKAGIAKGACLCKTNTEADAEACQDWRDPSRKGDLRLHVYIYNFTKPDDDVTSYEAIGPYVYDITIFKNDSREFNLENDEDTELTYREEIKYTFNLVETYRINPNLTLNDTFNVVDIPSIFILKFLDLSEEYQKQSESKNFYDHCDLVTEKIGNALMLFNLWNRYKNDHCGVDDLLNCENVTAALSDCRNLICRNVTVEEVLLTGIKSRSSQVAKDFSNKVLEESQKLGQTWLYQAWHEHVMPSDFSVYDGSFAFFNKYKKSHGDLTQIDRGLGNRENYGRVRKRKGRSEMNMYSFHNDAEASKCGSCNKITGTDGLMFPPFLNDNDNSQRWIQVFDSELCGVQNLKRVNEPDARQWRYFQNNRMDGVQVHYLNDTFVYTFQEKLPSEDTRRCYCEIGDKTMVGRMRTHLCGRDKNNTGIWPAKCKNGETMYFSKPYFMNISRSLKTDFNLDPRGNANNWDHTTVFEIEPNTGIVVSSHKRIQLNVAFPWPSAVNKIPHFELVPMMWYDESYRLNAEGLEHIQKNYFHLKRTIETVQWICLGIVSVVVIVGIGLFLRKGEEDKEYTEFIRALNTYNPLTYFGGSSPFD